MRFPTIPRPLRGAAAIALVAGVAHLATLSRYGFYRDELYFLACAKRLAWGFVDQPPLVPAIAALDHSGSLIVLRLSVALAAVATIMVAALLARELGAGRAGCTLCAVAVALMPGSLFLGNTLTTTSFEPLMWTLGLLCAVNLQRRWNTGWWFALCVICTLAAYTKYSIFLLLGTTIVSAALLRERRLLVSIATAGMVASVLLLPNVLWQAAHGFPMLAVLSGDVTGRHAFNQGPQYEYAGAIANAPAFAIEQLFFPGLLAAPLWIAGLLRSRLLLLTYALLFVIAIALAAKGYYLIGIYPALMAAGGGMFERFSTRIQTLAFAAIAVTGVALSPFALPVLPRPPALQPLFADEFGWDALTAKVAQTYRTLPASVRARTPIFADTYGVAAALDFYGARYQLPKAISGQNQYYLWGPRNYDLSSLLAVGASQYWTLKRIYRNVQMIAVFTDPDRRAVEGPTPIYFCSQPLVPLDHIWSALRWYGA